MMVPSKSLIAGLALAAMSTVGTAQTQTDTVPVTSVGTAKITMSTGEIVRGDAGEKTAGVANAFTNTDTSGFFGVGAVTNTATGNLVEWLDFGAYTADTGSDIVGEFTFGYGTSVTDALAGGPGATVTLRFYDGITGFCADSGAAPTATFEFTGLPGGPGGGAGAGWLITVDLTGGFEFCGSGQAQNFGFGFTTEDDTAADGTRDTGPLLCYAGDISDPVNIPDSNGQQDIFDEWDETPESNLCLGTFFFGGAPNNFSSWYLTVETADTSGAANADSSFRNGTGVNPANYTVSAPPVLGGAFQASDTQTNGGLGVFIVGYAPPLTLNPQFGEVLVNIADPGGEQLAGFNGPYVFASGTASITIPVPKNLNLCGVGLATQTVEFGGGVQLHNAQDLTVGF